MLEWHTCSAISFKGHTGVIFCDTGLTGNGTSNLRYHWFVIPAYPMVHDEPWDLQEIGSMVKWGCRGLQGVKIALFVAPFSILFSAVFSSENKTRNDLQSI